MGCWNSKPKPKRQTIVVHSCDYHTDHSPNGIVGILKSRSPSPSRYAADSTRIASANIKKNEKPKYVRQKAVAGSKRSTPSPHSAIHLTPEPEETTIQVMDAEDLEPAEYNPTPEPDAGTKSRLSNERSEATVSKIKLKRTGPSSVGTSQTQASKQSLLSSQDTLHVEEFDPEMDDFSRMSPVRTSNQSNRASTPAPTSTLLPLRKKKQDKDNISLQSIKERAEEKTKDEKIEHTKLKTFKAPREKKKKKEKVKREKVKEFSNENLRNVKWVEHNKESGEVKLHVGQNKAEKHAQEINSNEIWAYQIADKATSAANKEATFTKTDNKKVNDEQGPTTNETDINDQVQPIKDTIKSKKEKQLVNEIIKSKEDVVSNKKDMFEKAKEYRSSGIVCEAVEKDGGISLEYKDTKHAPFISNVGLKPKQNADAKPVEPRITSPLPKDLYQKELERVRMNRKRKRKVQRRNPDNTPRVPKPGDTEAMGYLGSNVIFKNKQQHVTDSVMKSVDLSSTENLSEFGSESRLSTTSDLSSMDKANDLLPDGVLFSDKTLTRDVDLYSLDSVEEKNNRFFTDKKNSMILADFSSPNDIPTGSSSSDIHTKQKLLYSKYERRPYSESVLRLAGRPPLPPDLSSNVTRPVSEKVRRAQAYSRYFTPDMDLY